MERQNGLLTASDIVGRAFRLWSHNLLFFLVLIALVQIPLWLITRGLGLVERPGLAVLTAVAAGIAGWVGGTLIQAAQIVATSELHQGRSVTVETAYAAAFSRLGRLLVAELMVVVAVGLMFITFIGIPLAIYFLVRWSFYGQAVMLEDASPRQALSLSSRLVVGGYWWRVLGVNLLFLLVVIAIGAGVGILFLAPLLIFREGAGAWVVDFIISMLGALAGAVYLYIGHTVLYHDQRLRRGEEGASAGEIVPPGPAGSGMP